jgi:histone H3/H4
MPEFVNRDEIEAATTNGVTDDAIEALNREVKQLLEDAEVRARANGRKRIREEDV